MIHRLTAIALCACLVGIVQADPIPIGDHSFENAAPNPGNWSNGPHGDGTGLGSWTEDDEATNGSFIEHITGFAADGTRHIGINGNSTWNNGNFDYNVFQDLGVGLQPDTEYTLTVAIGKRNEGFNPGPNADGLIGIAAFSVEVNGTAMATGTYTEAHTLPDSTFVDQSVSFITTANPPTGNIVVKLANIDLGLAQGLTAVNARAHFDNVRLDATVVPEPSGAVLALTLFMLPLALRRRRK